MNTKKKNDRALPECRGMMSSGYDLFAPRRALSEEYRSGLL
jgi:hypothetical protein